MPGARIALSTGRGAVSGRLPVGDVIERAARLLRGERAGDVRIDDVAAGVVGERFDVQRREGRLVLLGERVQHEAARTLLGKPTPCVGRERELAALASTFAEVAEERVARAVLVTATPGMGKSR